MSESTIRRAIIGSWLAVFLAVAIAGMLSGRPVTADTSLLWLIACVVPPTIMLFVWRGAPPPTVAEILNAVDRHN